MAAPGWNRISPVTEIIMVKPHENHRYTLHNRWSTNFFLFKWCEGHTNPSSNALDKIGQYGWEALTFNESWPSDGADWWGRWPSEAAFTPCGDDIIAQYDSPLGCSHAIRSRIQQTRKISAAPAIDAARRTSLQWQVRRLTSFFLEWRRLTVAI